MASHLWSTVPGTNSPFYQRLLRASATMLLHRCINFIGWLFKCLRPAAISLQERCFYNLLSSRVLICIALCLLSDVILTPKVTILFNEWALCQGKALHVHWQADTVYLKSRESVGKCDFRAASWCSAASCHVQLLWLHYALLETAHFD